MANLPNGENMLIDAGNNEDGPAIVAYLKKQGVTRLDYVVATHPHEDHIGGMDDVMKAFPVSKIYAPKAAGTTKTYDDFLQAVKNKKLTITTAQAGVKVIDQLNLKVTMMAPVGPHHDDLNNWSAVVRIQYGKNAFLFTGDAERQSESEMLINRPSLKSDVLKVGHHGSNTSTTQGFLQAVAPKYAVISVGVGNDYGHPHQETLDALAKAGVAVYRTDLNGTIVATSDGQTITFSTVKTAVQPRAPSTPQVTAPVPSPVPAPAKYVGNKSTKKFHLASCDSVSKMSPANKISFTDRDQAINQGYTACKACKPFAVPILK